MTRLQAELAELDRVIKAAKAPDVDAARSRLGKAAAGKAEAERALRSAEAGWTQTKLAAQKLVGESETRQKLAAQALRRAEELAKNGICPECGRSVNG